MQLKVESEVSPARAQDRSCTSSIYISTTSNSNNNNNDPINGNQQNVVSVDERQKPVLTIQVNQNSNENNVAAANNLVNIVSCFRANAYPTTITHSNNSSSSCNNVIENLVHNNNNNNKNSFVSGSNNLPFNVSVNKNHNEMMANCSKSDESVINNENNQNIVNIVRNFNQIKRCDDLNEITLADVNASSVSNVISNVDYQNMTLDASANKIDNVNDDDNNQITIVNNNNDDSNIVVESVNNQNNLMTKIVDENSQTYREQRRRDRRERRQARQRAQHGHHRHQVSVHQSRNGGANRTTHANHHQRIVNGMEQPSRGINGYEMLPDIINNHLPPPYTTLPIHQIRPNVAIAPPPPPSHLPPVPPPPQIIAPLPVVVDDCRFSFPIPIIRR